MIPCKCLSAFLDEMTKNDAMDLHVMKGLKRFVIYNQNQKIQPPDFSMPGKKAGPRGKHSRRQRHYADDEADYSEDQEDHSGCEGEELCSDACSGESDDDSAGSLANFVVSDGDSELDDESESEANVEDINISLPTELLPQLVTCTTLRTSKRTIKPHVMPFQTSPAHHDDNSDSDLKAKPRKAKRRLLLDDSDDDMEMHSMSKSETSAACGLLALNASSKEDEKNAAGPSNTKKKRTVQVPNDKALEKSVVSPKRKPGRPKGSGPVQKAKAAAANNGTSTSRRQPGRPLLHEEVQFPSKAADDPFGPCMLRVMPESDEAEMEDWHSWEMSVTIVETGKSIVPAYYLPRLKIWMEKRTEAASISTERGFAEDHLHIQAVARILLRVSFAICVCSTCKP